MSNIAPISELRNYGKVLDKVKPGLPLYLTKNGSGEYSIHSIEDDEEFEKARAMARLLSELNAGFLSGEEDGWTAEDALDNHFKNRSRSGDARQFRLS